MIPSEELCCVKVDDDKSECFNSCDLENSRQYEFPNGIAWDMIEIRLAELEKERSGLE